MAEFGELERAVMDVLWDRGGEPLTIRAVLQSLPAGREPAYTTVQTVMDRLVRKGVLQRRPFGKANCYRPVRSREDHAAGLMQQALQASGDADTALLHFVSRMDSAEADTLRAALARREPGPR